MKDSKLIAVETDRLYPQSRQSIGSENKGFPLNILLINLTRELGPVQGLVTTPFPSSAFLLSYPSSSGCCGVPQHLPPGKRTDIDNPHSTA